MRWNERVRAAREAQKLTRIQLVKKARPYLPSGETLSERALVAMELNGNEPRVTVAMAIARALGYRDVADLFSHDDGPRLNLAGINRLEEYRRLLLLSDEFREQPAALLRFLPVYVQPASAGTGQWLDDDMAEQTPVDDTVPASAAFGVRLAGNSMEPHFHDGQTVWVKPQETAETGNIIICTLNGQAFCKKLRRDAQGVALISLNKDYPPIEVGDDDTFRVSGVVVG